MSFGLPIGGVWAWLLLTVWLCIDWLNNLEMWEMPKFVNATVTTGLNVLGALRGQDGMGAVMSQTLRYEDHGSWQESPRVVQIHSPRTN